MRYVVTLPTFTYGETGKDKHMSKLIELESSLRCFESKAMLSRLLLSKVHLTLLYMNKELLSWQMFLIKLRLQVCKPYI